MSKYIDPDVLKAEIEKRKNICKGIFERDSDTYYQGKAVAYQETLSFIDTLQQEQPEVDLEKEIAEYWTATEWSKVITLGKFKVIARYFYGLGQLNSKIK